MKFKVGDKVIFNDTINRNSLGWSMEPALKFRYLTICEINTDGSYKTIEVEGLWSGMYWEPYEEPIIFDEDLFTI